MTSASSSEELTRLLRDHTRRGAALVVTHDLGLARRVADRVALLVAGALIAEASCDEFFERPPHPLARRFLEQGNCWPGSGGVPELPPHFRWIVSDRLAGMGKPGLLAPVENDLDAIAIAGVRLLVSLTERPLPAELLRARGIRGRHFPIADMGVPAMLQTARLCNEISRAMDAGEGVAVHCHAGLGRTGTILAAVLVWRGAQPSQAISELRATGRAYVQNEAQERFVQRFAEQT
ncbi:MAG: protein-tyrosine phosphatase family protein [Polyangiaceae bacterium]